MIYRMGNDDGPDGSDALLWLFGGTAVAIALHHLFLKPAQADVRAFLEVEEPSFPDLNSVAVRFGQIRELWSMGYLSSEDTVYQLGKLSTALLDLQKSGKASVASVQDLTARIDRLINDVVEYQAAA